jgi:predicted nucleic acid-binding protein
MSKSTFLFDTYAILEIIEGNDAYEPYLDAEIVINDFVFAELCHRLMRENVTGADEMIEKYVPFIAHADPETIKEAMVFRIKNKEKNMSMTDCISYVMAKKLRIKFLTGDKEFEKLPQVEFIK